MEDQLEALNKACSIAEKAGLELLEKSHVKAYTRADGTQVAEHDDSRDVRKEIYNDAREKAEIASGEASDRNSHVAAAKAHRRAASRAPDSQTAYNHRQKADEHEMKAKGTPTYRRK